MTAATIKHAHLACLMCIISGIDAASISRQPRHRGAARFNGTNGSNGRALFKGGRFALRRLGGQAGEQGIQTLIRRLIKELRQFINGCYD
jgi:hypothetical protein